MTGRGAGTTGAPTEGDHKSLLDEIGDGVGAIVHGVEHAAASVVDFLGFDGNFGYDGPQGPEGGARSLSLSGIARALRGQADHVPEAGISRDGYRTWQDTEDGRSFRGELAGAFELRSTDAQPSFEPIELPLPNDFDILGEARRALHDQIARAERALLARVQLNPSQTPQLVTQFVEYVADQSISYALVHYDVTPSARLELTEFRDGTGSGTPRIYNNGSAGLDELLNGGAGRYYRGEVYAAINQMAFDNGGTIPNAATLPHFKSMSFGLTGEGFSSIDGTVDMSDIIGTFTYGLNVEARGDRLYFEASNNMSLTSFAAGNIVAPMRQFIIEPQSGPFSTTRQLFRWDTPNPYSGSMNSLWWLRNHL